MKLLRRSLGLLLLFIVPLASGQKAPANAKQIPVETTVCKILENPSVYNNKMIKVHGYVQASFEYSVLLDENCPDWGVWFAFADRTGPPELKIMIAGEGTPGAKDSRAHPIPSIPVHLVKDDNFAQLQRYWEISTKGAACAEGPPPDFPPECTTYRVTATFTGRLDSISKEVQKERRKRSGHESADWKGFGHMGMFDAQIVVQSVENVVAVAEEEIRERQSKPH